jgi:hypothetical protein
VSDTTPQEGRELTSLTGPIDDNDGLVGVTFNHQWQQEIGGTFTDIDGATNARFTPDQDQVGRRLRVVVRFTDANGTAESATSDPSAEVTAAPAATDPPAGGPQLRSAPDAGAQAPGGSTPGAGVAGTGAAGGQAGGATTVAALSLPPSISVGGTLTLSLTVPDAGDVTQISLFESPNANAARKSARKVAKGKLIARVYRNTPKAKRYKIRLTQKELRKLKPGRYVVEVRVGKSRTSLGPAKVRTITVKKAKAKRSLHASKV